MNKQTKKINSSLSFSPSKPVNQTTTLVQVNLSLFTKWTCHCLPVTSITLTDQSILQATNLLVAVSHHLLFILAVSIQKSMLQSMQIIILLSIFTGIHRIYWQENLHHTIAWNACRYNVHLILSIKCTTQFREMKICKTGVCANVYQWAE